MSSGKKTYFRHSFGARNNTKLLLLRDEVGVGFYFFYFSLLEICGEVASVGFDPRFEFHDSTIRKLWGVNLKKCRTISEKMDAVGLLEFKKGEKTFQFTIPNYLKYLGRYTNKKDPKNSNKIKKEKLKGKKVKATNISPFDFDAVYKIYPRKSGKTKGLEKCSISIKDIDKYNALLQSVKNYSAICDAEGTEQKYIKMFSTFMGCWEDYIDIEIPLTIEQKRKKLDAELIAFFEGGGDNQN